MESTASSGLRATAAEGQLPYWRLASPMGIPHQLVDAISIPVYISVHAILVYCGVTDQRSLRYQVAGTVCWQARCLDESLHNIIRLESAAAGGGKSAVASKEQLTGKEKLQVSLVRISPLFQY